MNGPFDNILKSVGDLLTAGVCRAAGRVVPAVVAIWLTCLFVIVAVAAAAIASYFYLSLTMPSYSAMLIVTGGALALAVLSAVIGWGMATRDAPAPAADKVVHATVAAQDSAADLAITIEREARRAIHGNAKNAALISLVAGIALGISPELRMTLLRLLPK